MSKRRVVHDGYLPQDRLKSLLEGMLSISRGGIFQSDMLDGNDFVLKTAFRNSESLALGDLLELFDAFKGISPQFQFLNGLKNSFEAVDGARV
jgi:hypothetical protein